MVAEVARNGWGIVGHHQQEGILELRWLPSTTEMTDADVKATLVLFAEQAERAGPLLLLIDATEFRHRFDERVMAWRDQQIIPRYNASDTSRFAFHVPEGFPDAMEPAGNPSPTVPPASPPPGSPSASTPSTGSGPNDGPHRGRAGRDDPQLRRLRHRSRLVCGAQDAGGDARCCHHPAAVDPRLPLRRPAAVLRASVRLCHPRPHPRPDCLRRPESGWA
jgi:hypothetical protein